MRPKFKSQINNWECGYKGLVFVEIIVEMDKGLRPKIPQNSSIQFVCPSPNIWDFKEKMFHWASVVRGLGYNKVIKIEAQN